jgi:hypothetical protein
MKDHQLIDARSLAFGQQIATRVAIEPKLIAQARETVLHWLVDCSSGSRSELEEWLSVLDGPVEQVIQLLTGLDERAIRLRQSNPFAGVLSAQERNQILKRFQQHDAAST